MDRSPWGKVVGKHPPLDAAADEIEDGVEDFAPVDGLRPPSRFGLGTQGLDQLLLGIGQIGGVFCASHTLFYAQNKGSSKPLARRVDPVSRIVLEGSLPLP